MHATYALFHWFVGIKLIVIDDEHHTNQIYNGSLQRYKGFPLPKDSVEMYANH